MYYIIGLGNPGKRYQKTRHNIGFRVVDAIAEDRNVRWKVGQGEFMIGVDGKDDFTLVKPMTFMNNSGAAVKQISMKQDFQITNLLIIYDDLDLPLGKLRFRPGGSPGSHLGMRSIVKKMGSRDIPRLRLGIGSELKKGPSEEFVLEPFSKEEKIIADEVAEIAARGVMTFMHRGIEAAMNQYNQLDLTT